jgi:hypothetical protein
MIGEQVQSLKMPMTVRQLYQGKQVTWKTRVIQSAKSSRTWKVSAAVGHTRKK